MYKWSCPNALLLYLDPDECNLLTDENMKVIV